MKLQPGFRLLVCTILFCAELWVGRSQAASITFDKSGLKHGSAISTSFNAPYLTDFGFTIIADKLNIPGRQRVVIFDSTGPFYDGTVSSNINSANRIDPITAAQSGWSQFDWVEINFGGPEALNNTRSHLKNVFWPPAFFGGIGASFQILDNQQIACGLKLGPTAPVSAKPSSSRCENEILKQNPVFEMASKFIPVPEPASMLLVGSGLIVLAGIGRRKILKKKK